MTAGQPLPARRERRQRSSGGQGAFTGGSTEALWAWGRRPPPQPDLRVSTAERGQVADALSQHYAEGRLDEREFDERLEQAMGAKTRADLAGLLVDLPSPEGAAPAARARRHPRVAAVVVVLVLCSLVLSIAASAVATPHVPFVLVVAVLAWLLLHRRHARGSGPASPR